MEFNTTYIKILTDESLMETMSHGDRLYPFCFYYDKLDLYDFHCVDWHWHPELEFVLVEKGTVSFGIGADQFVLQPGEGVFINSRLLHRYSSEDAAITPNILCLPSFIASEESLLYQKYVQPFLSSSFPYQIFRKEVPWQKAALSILHDLVAHQLEENPQELYTSYRIQELWLLLYQNIPLPLKKVPEDASTSSLARLQLMMQYIHESYPKDISLEDIAGHASVSKSTALNLFRKHLQTTPVTYLILYRLKLAASLLANTEKKIQAIAEETGFRNVGYFCKTFKKHYGKTPRDYRDSKILQSEFQFLTK